MEENDDGDELVDEQFVRVISLGDSTEDLTEEFEDSMSFDESMEVNDLEASSTNTNGSIDLDDEENFTIVISEPDCIISACNEEVFVVSCFENRWLAVGSKDDRARLYDLHSTVIHEPVLRIDNHKDSVICAQFSANGHLLATGDMSGFIVISDTTGRKQCYTESYIFITFIKNGLKRTLTRHVARRIDDCEELSWIQWHFSTNVLLAGGKNGIWMWLLNMDSVQQTKIYLCDSPAPSIDGILLNDGRRLISCYEDGSVRLWSLKDEKPFNISMGAKSATCMDVHRIFPMAIIGDLEAHCFLVNTENAKILRIFTVADHVVDCEIAIECVKFCPGKEPWFIVGTNCGHLAIYDFIGGTLRHKLKNSFDPVVRCCWYQPDSNKLYVIASGYSGAVRVWDGRNGSAILAVLPKNIMEQDTHLLSMDLSVDKLPFLYTAYSSGEVCKFSLVGL